jgi:hypothetical protein
MSSNHAPTVVDLPPSDREVRWVLTMFAESLVQGMRLAADGLMPPQADDASFFTASLRERWLRLLFALSRTDAGAGWCMDRGIDAAEAAYHLMAVERTARFDLEKARMLAVTWSWCLSRDAAVWERAPGVRPAPWRLENISLEWLGNAVFEYLRRLPVAPLRHRPLAFEAPRWVLANLPEQLERNLFELPDWEAYHRPLTPADLEDETL